MSAIYLYCFFYIKRWHLNTRVYNIINVAIFLTRFVRRMATISIKLIRETIKELARSTGMLFSGFFVVFNNKKIYMKKIFYLIISIMLIAFGFISQSEAAISGGSVSGNGASDLIVNTTDEIVMLLLIQMWVQPQTNYGLFFQMDTQ